MTFQLKSRFLAPLVALSFLAGGFIPRIMTQQAMAANAGRPWLGVSIEKGESGVLVKGVMPSTPAENAGIKQGDQILKIDSKIVKEPQELITAVQSAGIGQLIAVEILRGKEVLVKKLKLVMKPDELQLLRERLVGKSAPPFNLEVVKGKEPGDSKKLLGRVTVFEFWATWCPACRATHKRLSEFATANPSVAVIAISDEEKSVIDSYAKKIDPKFTILRDAEGKVLGEWMVGAIPMLGVIDKSGKIVFVTVGAGEAAEEVLSAAAKISK